MLEPKRVRVEVYPVAADRAGIWLLSGLERWQSDNVMADTTVHAEVEHILAGHGILEDAVMVHSTSWHEEGPSVFHNYMSVVQKPGYAREHWPSALPLTTAVSDKVGRPTAHAADEAPKPRYIDVALHGIRHLRFLFENDATARTAMGETWLPHLQELEPVLAGLYGEPYVLPRARSIIPN